jgi:DNA polymerase I-like protein with 3'-5' exonuclease and polymerase domains
MTLQGDLFPPDSDWVCPVILPDIPEGIPIAVDLETRDPGIQADLGSSWPWNDGNIVGVAVAWLDQKIYLPLRHPETANIDAEKVLSWLHETMLTASAVVFHNAAYDLGWLTTFHFDPAMLGDRLHDTHAMSVMLDENRLAYDLNAVAVHYGLPGKDDSLLNHTAKIYKINPKGELWKLPAKYVGPYAEQDARATLDLFDKLQHDIAADGLNDAYRLEADLIPMVVKMRQRGVYIDSRKAEKVKTDMKELLRQELIKIRDLADLHYMPSIDTLRSPKRLGEIFDQLKVPYPRTAKSQQPQFQKEWLHEHKHAFPQMVARARQLADLSDKFIDKYILGAAQKGRIHAEIHQLRDDNSGTRSYRLSYSNPPLQQMPARGDKTLSALIRSLFLPEKETQWLSADYSQQEPRLAVHYASLCGLPSAQRAVDYYSDNPDADFHYMVAEFVGIDRTPAKTINLGIMYGMGEETMADRLKLPIDEARRMLALYDEKLPFVKELSDFAKRRADSVGYVRLLDGARCRFDHWVPPRTFELPLPRRLAEKRWPDKQLKRAFIHKAMNRLIQGSAARQTKIAMRECYLAGHLPILQLHDELAFSVGSLDQAREAVAIMRDCVKLRVPVKVDSDMGPSWGEAKEINLWPGSA